MTRQRVVITGAATGIGAETALIASGIRGGEQIVVVGTHKLSAGDEVRAIEDEG